MRSALVAIVLAGACGGPTKSTAPAPAPTPAPPVATPAPKPEGPPAPEPPRDPRLAADLASFDKVWTTIKDTYYDPKLGGLDWNGFRTELRPKVEASKDRDEARNTMGELLKRLGKSHFGVAASHDADDSQAPDKKVGGDAELPVEVRIVDGAAIVFRVEDTPETKKLLPGMQFVKIDGVAVADKLAKVANAMPGSSLVPMQQARAVMRMLRGADGTRPTLEMLDGGKPVTLTPARKPPVGRMVSLGNLGPEPLLYKEATVDKKIAYVRLSIFLDPGTVIPAFGGYLGKVDGWASGLVIDLRGNPGGLGAMAMGMAGHLVAEENKKLGTMKTRQASLEFIINPQPARFRGKVAILVDELSASTSEIFAGGMQDLGRAKVFGRRTPGAALPSVIDVLPNGDRFQYAIADYVSASGKVLEGNGVTPDVVVRLDPKSLRSGVDPDMFAALRWLHEEKKP